MSSINAECFHTSIVNIVFRLTGIVLLDYTGICPTYLLIIYKVIPFDKVYVMMLLVSVTHQVILLAYLPTYNITLHTIN